MIRTSRLGHGGFRPRTQASGFFTLRFKTSSIEVQGRRVSARRISTRKPNP